MKSNEMNTRDKRVLCPFFKASGERELRCEGPIEDVNVRLMFKTNLAFDDQKRIFCEKLYKRCEIYRSVMYNRYHEVEQ